jgi:hypothetical protein
MFDPMAWNFDRWLAVVSLVLGLGFSYFAVTSERLASFLIRWRLREMPAAFREMTMDYRQAGLIPDDPGPVTRPPSDTRVRRKDVLAEGLGAYALARGLSRAALARGDDGYVAALMKLITFDPRRSDVALVVLAAATKVPPHTDYLTLDAIRVLAGKGLIGEDQRGAIGETVERVGERLREDHQSAVEKARVALRKA